MSELLTTARPYAKALFKSAKEQNMLDNYFDMLKNLNLVVNDESVKNIKGGDRPIMDMKSRVATLASLEFVDMIFQCRWHNWSQCDNCSLGKTWIDCDVGGHLIFT